MAASDGLGVGGGVYDGVRSWVVKELEMWPEWSLVGLHLRLWCALADHFTRGWLVVS